MKKVIIFLCIILMTQKLYAQTKAIEEFLQNDPRQKYLVLLPRQYTNEQSFPLLVAIHWYNGTAEQQINEWKFIAHKNSYILLCPQFSEGYQGLAGGEGERLNEIINEIKNKFSVDSERIYLVGFSGGAQFTLRFAYRYPFIKAACILSLGDYDTPPVSASAKSVKYFLGVGEKDERYRTVLKLHTLLQKRGYDVIFQSFPMVGHTLHSSMKNVVMEFLRAAGTE